MAILEDNESRFISHFSNPSEILADLDLNCRDSHAANDWNGGVTLEQAIELVNCGWPKGVQEVQSMQLKDFSRKVDHILEVEHATSGSYVDIGRYVEGVPECMLEYSVPFTGRFCHIIVLITCHCQVSPNAIYGRGFYLASMIDSLESRGIRTRVTAIASAEKRFKCVTSIQLKDYSHVMDLDTLIFWIAHPAALRHIVFSHWYQHDLDSAYKLTGRLGFPDTQTWTTCPHLSDYDVVFPMASGYSSESVCEAAQKILNQYLDNA